MTAVPQEVLASRPPTVHNEALVIVEEIVMEVKAWEVLSDSLVHKADIFSLRRQCSRSPSSGRKHSFDILECVDWVNIVALTDGGNVVLIRQYRHGTGEVTCEIPGGALDPGEEPQAAAERELFEETGYRADRFELIGSVKPNPAFQTNCTYTYLACGARLAGAPQPDENEEIEVFERPLAEILELLRTGAIEHALVLCAFLHLALRGGFRLGDL